MPSVPTPSTPPDYPFAIACGCYAAAWVAPVAAGAATLVTDDPGALYVLLLSVGVAAIALGVAAVRDSPGLAVRAGRRDSLWALAVLPFAWFPVGFVVETTRPDGGPILAVGVVGAAAGFAAGLGLVSAARSRYAAAALDVATQRTSVTARWPPRVRRAAVAVAGAGVVVAVAGALATALGGPRYEDAFYALYVLPLTLSMVTWVREERTIRVLDVGIAVERGSVTRFRPWERFTRYAVTEAAVVVGRTGWRPAMRIDRADVADVDALADALDRSLPRR